MPATGPPAASRTSATARMNRSAGTTGASDGSRLQGTQMTIATATAQIAIAGSASTNSMRRAIATTVKLASPTAANGIRRQPADLSPARRPTWPITSVPAGTSCFRRNVARSPLL